VCLDSLTKQEAKKKKTEGGNKKKKEGGNRGKEGEGGKKEKRGGKGVVNPLHHPQTEYNRLPISLCH
jgi:hypothetical protein